jgi:hypothetical protein
MSHPARPQRHRNPDPTGRVNPAGIAYLNFMHNLDPHRLAGDIDLTSYVRVEDLTAETFKSFGFRFHVAEPWQYWIHRNLIVPEPNPDPNTLKSCKLAVCEYIVGCLVNGLAYSARKALDIPKDFKKAGICNGTFDFKKRIATLDSLMTTGRMETFERAG